MYFKDKIRFNLRVRCGSSEYTIPSEQVAFFNVEADTFGFEAKVGFWSDTTVEDIFSDLFGDEVSYVYISYESIVKQPEDRCEARYFKGPVFEKTCADEIYNDLMGQPLLYRYYELSFKDTASLFWREHHPSLILADSTYSQMLKENAVEGVDTSVLWTEFEKERSIIAVHLPQDKGANFYDYMMWLIDSYGGYFYYDSQLNRYFIAQIKPSTSTSGVIEFEDVEKTRVTQGKRPRHVVRVLNTFSDDNNKETVGQSDEVKGVRHDHLIKTHLKNVFSDKKNLEDDRLIIPKNGMSLELKSYCWAALNPGSVIDFSEGLWPENYNLPSSIMRVKKYSADFKAETPEPEMNREFDAQVCDMRVSVELEEVSDTSITFPEYNVPQYPLKVEAKVISEVGEDDDMSFNIYTDKETSLDYYHVHIPLWNKEVRVLFENDHMTPHFFFPIYRDCRVLLEFEPERASIAQVLDFGPRVRMPMDSQGNQMLFGFNDVSQTSINHMYMNNKPILNVERKVEAESELIRLSDGTILLQTTSEGGEGLGSSGTSLVPKSEAAKADLKIKTMAGVAESTACFDDSNSELNDELDSCVSDCDDSLDAVTAVLDEQVNEAMAVIDGALGQMDQTAGALGSKYEEAKAELLEQLKL